VVFLDIEMPDLDRFGVLDSLPQDQWPIVIFTTAYGHYAIRAFEVHALHYLLKPVTPTPRRVHRSIEVDARICAAPQP
jgi:two-component system LytT family response regulator